MDDPKMEESLKSLGLIAPSNFSDEEREHLRELHPEVEIEKVRYLFLFRKLIQELKMRITDSILWRTFVTTDALVYVTTDIEASQSDIRDLVKIPDLVANASNGAENLDEWFDKLVRCVQFTRQVPTVNEDLLPKLIEAIFFNYQHRSKVMEDLFNVFESNPMAGKPGYHLGNILAKVSATGKELILKNVICCARNQSDFVKVLGPAREEDINVYLRLIFFKLDLKTPLFSWFIKYIRQSVSSATYTLLLEKSLTLWGDQHVAKGNVRGEILRYTKVASLLLMYLDEKLSPEVTGSLMEKLVKGLPNHFNSSDGRTILLAQFFANLVTKAIRGSEDEKPVFDSSENETVMNEPLVHELVHFLKQCDKTACEDFLPLINELKISSEETNVKEENEALGNNLPPVDDDDDDSDLEPIESLTAPKKTDVHYIRHFLEKVPPMESHDDVASAFKAIPEIIEHQLSLEHSQVGRDLLKMLFYWENQFEDPKLDELRKLSLKNVITTKPEGNLEYLCQLFHEPHVQAYRKNIILDVITKASQKVKLKELDFLCKTSFRLILLNEGVMNSQDTLVRIPLVLFFGRLLCLVPHQLIREEYVVSYMKSISNMNNVDSATEQTIRYSLNNVLNAIGDLKLETDVRSSISNTRDWLLKIEFDR